MSEGGGRRWARTSWRSGRKKNNFEPEPIPPRHCGRIKNFNPDKGFGFIECPEVEKDVYVHCNNINGFEIGHKVTFTLEEDGRGPKAVHLEHAPEDGDFHRDRSENSSMRRSGREFRNRDQHGPEGQYQGKISYIDPKGGYIDCPEVPEAHEGIFCKSNQVNGFNVGDRVQFHLKLHRGKQQAYGLSYAPDAGAEILSRLLRNEVEDNSDSLHGFPNRDRASSMDEQIALHQGVIKNIYAEKGFGFITPTSLSIGCDIYVHHNHLNGFKVNDIVNFSIKDHKGKPQAHNLSACDESVVGAALLLDGFSTAGHSSSSSNRGLRGPYQGQVKTFDEEKGYGFITCKEVFEEFNVDTFVHQKGLKGKTTLCAGDYVSFFIKRDDKNRPQATKVSICDPPVGGLDDDPLGFEDKIDYHGSIKSFVSTNDNEGYGFITCEEVTDKYKRDAFVHRKQIKSFKPGDAVMFSVRPNNLGHPQAYNLREAPQSVAWLTTLVEEPVPEESPVVDKEEYLGEIKSFSHSKGFGFIQCQALFERYGRDVFIHQAQFTGLGIGDRVSFRTQVKKGQPQAHDVVRLSQAPSASSSSRLGELSSCGGPTLDKRLLRACASARVTSVDEMQLLMQAGANPNCRDVTGQTTIMIAALNVRHSERKCRLLIEGGAKIDNACSLAADAQTVHQWARERINAKFAKFLEACQNGEAVDPEIELFKGISSVME